MPNCTAAVLGTASVTQQIESLGIANRKSELLVVDLVNLLDGWATAATGTWRSAAKVWHAATRHATVSSSSLVHLHHDGIHHALKLLLLCLEFVLLCQLVLVEPVKGVL